MSVFGFRRERIRDASDDAKKAGANEAGLEACGKTNCAGRPDPPNLPGLRFFRLLSWAVGFAQPERIGVPELKKPKMEKPEGKK